MTRFPEDLEARLRAAAPAGIDFSAATDSHGVTSAWVALADKDELKAVGEVMARLGARLSLITGSQTPPPPEVEDEEEEEAEEGETAEAAEKPVPMTFGGTPMDGTAYEITYSFDLVGDTVTVIAYAPQGGSVESLTSLFRTADWPEREIMETYNLRIENHPDPRRLFLDKSIEPAVMERLIPFSTLTNASSTTALWEKVMESAKAKEASES
ncbi:NADH-quinone oxidoreductase subunit C [Consotaella salsifontis]|uniref:Respiratory-chain NADH dehydrogenase, subunit n=1 Tax=Consotaella salsifontis TaxID=1365950 RepID=A0A1T4LGH0_9HYPH|nr:NADH-quinone oxidoreductase subunit C [Consotaella salsifontis]SJZ53594.1 Respiratory-chain NADH dehydrogenase, subunit [Consotaella salsifontis]